MGDESKLEHPTIQSSSEPPFNNQKGAIPTESITINEGWKTILKVFLSEPTKFIFVLAFLLYFIGFAIWHFYLATFGVSSMPFLQTEYVSAAFCFLFMFFGLSLPPFIFFRTLGKTIFSSGLTNFYKWDAKWATILFAWYFITGKLIQIFLPNSKLSPFGGKVLNIVVILIVIHFIFGIYLFYKGGYMKSLHHGNNAKLTEKEKLFRGSRLIKFGNPFTCWPIYIGILLFINLCFNTEIDKAFLFITVIYWLGAGSIPGVSLKETWAESDFILRSVIVIGICLFFIIYIQIFSINQFGLIAKSVGGGKPEDACFNVPEKYLDVVQSMGVQKYTLNLESNNMLGPVGILLRTDNEILFVNHQDSTTHATNTFTVRQIRSDLIDGITFLKIRP